MFLLFNCSTKAARVQCLGYTDVDSEIYKCRVRRIQGYTNVELGESEYSDIQGNATSYPKPIYTGLPNISRISRALSPMYLSTMALETTFRKFASSCLATARASSVLPVPVMEGREREREREGRKRGGKVLRDKEGR